MDINHIPERHAEIDRRLRNWARYVAVHPRMGFIQPMFKQSRTSRQWDEHPHIKTDIDTLDGHRIEKAVSALPEKTRVAVRWFYVWPWVNDGKVRRELHVTRTVLWELVYDGRTMLTNTLRM